jgi:hypothetical protein
MENGVYQLNCLAWNKRYVRQTRRPFQTRYKEHRREYQHNTLKFNFAKHLTEEGHPFPPWKTAWTCYNTSIMAP